MSFCHSRANGNPSAWSSGIPAEAGIQQDGRRARRRIDSRFRGNDEKRARVCVSVIPVKTGIHPLVLPVFPRTRESNMTEGGHAGQAFPLSSGFCVSISENRFLVMSVTVPIISVTSFHSSGVRASFKAGFNPHLALTCRPSRSTCTAKISVSTELAARPDGDVFRCGVCSATMDSLSLALDRRGGIDDADCDGLLFLVSN